MSDPSTSVSSQLLHHLHAVCVMKYPSYQSIQPDALIDLLLKAPTATQQYPLTWSMIEPPSAGTLMLTWHPPQMGASCASDGYVWADPENVHTVDVKGYQVEIYYHKAGFNPNPNQATPQTHAVFSRRCYRLKPSAPTSPPETHNFWLLHYLTAERQNQVPVSTIPITQGARQSFSARSYIAQLFATGQLARKEFFLHDPSTWPLVTLPNQQQVPQQPPQPPQTPQGARQMAPRGTPMAAAQQQQPYYTPTPTRAAPPKPAPPSAKRLKPTPPAHVPVADPGMTIDEEEDTSRGDMLDHLSPREIATTRYIQHHEWMEEVLGSAYSISRITPVDLGLGLRGELESVTMGLLDAPVHPPPPAAPGAEKKDQAAILDQFRPRVENKIAEIEAEIAKMEELHKARLSKIAKSGVAKEAELRLREAPTPESVEEGVDPVIATVMASSTDMGAVDAVVAAVENAVGKKVVEKMMVLRWELPNEEIVKMGGVVAEGGSGLDIEMGKEGELEEEEGEFSLDLGVGTGEEFGVGDVGVGGMAGGGEGVGDGAADTIMSDFMNVDSKPETPVEKKEDGQVGGEAGTMEEVGFAEALLAGDGGDGLVG